MRIIANASRLIQFKKKRTRYLNEIAKATTLAEQRKAVNEGVRAVIHTLSIDEMKLLLAFIYDSVEQEIPDGSNKALSNL